ncbi:MAG: HAMP domain-containing histidine kinase [Deltaproteobacteria bacterium]|jgi:two-component system phosphate regulon sensor histidine kinase PhoR|nr:HAMP domain-containing histidine kinase [Deltaproteobacteria bacterium]MBW2530325.1 HAMP domain-containing histidine kinase [Deltaproteobacteria bacterium]
MARAAGPKKTLSEWVLYFVLVPATFVAVVLLGAAALRTTLQMEKARQQTVFDATLSVAEERVDRLDKMIIKQDNAVIANVDVSDLGSIAARWLPTADRETPTVRAVLVLGLDSPTREVRAFVSRAPGPEDDRFRRLLVARLLGQLELEAEPVSELRHLHQAFEDQSYLISYWQRRAGTRRYLVVAWHHVPNLVHGVMPDLYRDLDRTSRMNVVDQRGRILFGPPIRAGGFTVGLPFPTTLYNWRLQVALTSAEGLERRAVNQRMVQLAMVGLAMLVAAAGVVIVARAYVNERRLAALKGDFVANVSHELKTPLSSVRMFGEMLLSGRAKSDAKRREYLQIIVGESERLTNLIDNVLDFAKVERGKDAYEFTDGDVGELVAHVVDSLQYRAERQRVELRVDVEPCRAVFDSRAVELAVTNMVDNALKYAAGTEAVEVTVRRLDPDAGEEEMVGARIRVADMGPGIESAEQDRIFDRFVRGREAYDQHVRGSGIGLALVKHIADSHGGRVTVESPLSDEGRGTAFELELPDAPPGHHADR